MYERPSNTSNFDDVGNFHIKFNLANTLNTEAGPRPFDPALMQFRVKFLLEEIMEFMEAIGAELITDGESTELKIAMTDDQVDHAKAFDALLDLVYVAMGTAHFMGYPWQQGWDLVQAANMGKVRAKADGSDSKRGSSFDVVKPPNWTPPNIEGLLARRGWTNHNEETK